MARFLFVVLAIIAASANAKRFYFEESGKYRCRGKDMIVEMQELHADDCLAHCHQMGEDCALAVTTDDGSCKLYHSDCPSEERFSDPKFTAWEHFPDFESHAPSAAPTVSPTMSPSRAPTISPTSKPADRKKFCGAMRGKPVLCRSFEVCKVGRRARCLPRRYT